MLYGGITTVGSVKSIGEKLKGVTQASSKTKTREASTNKSNQRGAQPFSQKNDLWQKQNLQRNSHAQNSSKLMSVNSKNQHQPQRHQGDVSGSHFLNSERSSVNHNQNIQMDPSLVKELKGNSNKYTIQYSNNQGQGKYMMMFHNT